MKDTQFLVIGFSMLDNEDYREIMTSNKGIEMTYQWLRRNIVRAPMNNPYSNEVYKRFFLKGYLAVSICEEDLATKLFISRPTLRKNLMVLNKNGFIRIKQSIIKATNPTQKSQNVYILGKWKNEIFLNNEERYTEFLFSYDILKKPIFDISPDEFTGVELDNDTTI